MSEIQIDVAKSWNELRWIDDQEVYRSHLAQFAKDQISKAKDLANAVETDEWSSANIQILPLLLEIETRGAITKNDLIRTIPQIESDFKSNKSSQIILQQNLITCIHLVQNSLFQRGKKTKMDIAKIAELALQSRFKSRKELVYVYKGIVYPYFGCYDIDATLHQIQKDKRNASRITTTNLLSLIGLSVDLSEQLKLLYPEARIVPQSLAAQDKPSNSNPPPVIVTDRECDAFHSLLIGRKTKISFHRTLRVPEDGNDYPLPAGLGAFPIHRVEDYADTVPLQWLEEGGFFMPLYQKEALFIQFESEEWCPSIAKVCVGGINAITGKNYSEKLSSHSQDYVVIPKQKWLDGINSGDGTVSQFVAMPLGQGYTVEAQITDEEKQGGFQLICYEPIDGRFQRPVQSLGPNADFVKRVTLSELESLNKNLNRREKAVIDCIREGGMVSKAAFLTGLETREAAVIYNNYVTKVFDLAKVKALHYFSKDPSLNSIISLVLENLRKTGFRVIHIPESDVSKPDKKDSILDSKNMATLGSSPEAAKDLSPYNGALFSSAARPSGSENIEEMGIAAGGKIKQQIFQDTFGIDSWDYNKRRVIKVYMVNSIVYKNITGKEPPISPVTLEHYQDSGIPWFSHYDENIQSLKSAGAFKKIIGVESIDKRRGIVDVRPISDISIGPELLRKIKTPDLNEAIQDFRRRSRENAQAGRWEAALREINYLIDLESGVEAQDYALRSLCNYQITRYFEGMFDGDKALELDSRCYDALSSRGYCRLYLGDFHGVKEDAEQLFRNPDTELIGLELRAEASLRSGYYNDAIYDALSLGKKRPGYRRADEILDEARSKAHQEFEEKRSK